MNEIRQGEVWLVDFNPVRGDEMQKRRPALVLSGNFSTGLALRIVVPITGWQHDFSKIWWLCKIDNTPMTGLEKTSAANCFQMRCVSTARFIRKLGALSPGEMEEITATAQNCIELDMDRN